MPLLNAAKRAAMNAGTLIVNFTHGALVVLGIVTIVCMAYTLLGNNLQLLRPIATNWVSLDHLIPQQLMPEDAPPKVSPRTRAVADYIARKHRVSPEAAVQLLLTAEDAAQKEGVDSMLVVAVMAIESGFNPIAESNKGAQGLMQVIPRYHQDKLEDLSSNILDPATNIRVGARVLKAYLAQADSITGALQMYCGAPRDPNAAYAARVLEKKRRLEDAARLAA